MGFFGFNAARRRAIIKETSVFQDIDSGKLANEKKDPIPQKVQPSFTGGKDKKPNIRKVLQERRTQAENRYLNALANKNVIEEKKALHELNAVKRSERGYSNLKKEKREKLLAPVKQGFNILSTFGKNISIKRKKRAAKGIYKQTHYGGSNIEFGSEVMNSPFRRR